MLASPSLNTQNIIYLNNWPRRLMIIDAWK